MKDMTQSEVNQIASRLREFLAEARGRLRGIPGDHLIYPFLQIDQRGNISLHTGQIGVVGENLADFWKRAEAKLKEDPKEAEIARLKAKLAELEGGAE